MKNWQKEFRKQFKHSQFVDYSKIENFIQSLLDEEKKDLERRIGLLRQWLNEKPKNRVVTNEDLEIWLLK